jgi:hypothetical protein
MRKVEVGLAFTYYEYTYLIVFIHEGQCGILCQGSIALLNLETHMQPGIDRGIFKCLN